MSRALWRRLLALPGEVEAFYVEGWERAEATYARRDRAEAERAALALERDGLAAELQKVGAELARWKEAHGEASARADGMAARVAQLGAAADQAGERAARAEELGKRAKDAEDVIGYFRFLFAEFGGESSVYMGANSCVCALYRARDQIERMAGEALAACASLRADADAQRAMLEGRIAHQRAVLLKVRRAVGVALISLRPRPDQKPPDVETALYHLEPLAPLETADDVGGADGS